MPSPKEFREFALECMRRADESQEQRYRQIFLDLAAQWMRAAVRLEEAVTAINDDPPLVPNDDV